MKPSIWTPITITLIHVHLKHHFTTYIHIMIVRGHKKNIIIIGWIKWPWSSTTTLVNMFFTFLILLLVNKPSFYRPMEPRSKFIHCKHNFATATKRCCSLKDGGLVCHDMSNYLYQMNYNCLGAYSSSSSSCPWDFAWHGMARRKMKRMKKKL